MLAGAPEKRSEPSGSRVDLSGVRRLRPDTHHLPPAYPSRRNPAITRAVGGQVFGEGDVVERAAIDIEPCTAGTDS